MTTKTQTRGHCQLCGRQQAYHRGAIAKHGYTVDHGYFNGVCHGADFKPLEIERTELDRVVAQIRDKEIPEMRAQLEKVQGGWRPETVMVEQRTGLYRRGKAVKEMVEKPFGEVYPGEYHAQQWTRSTIWKIEQRIKHAGDAADQLLEMAEKVHGQEMEVIKIAAPPEYIGRGEKRKLGNGKVATVHENQGRRIVFRWVENDKVRQSWMAPISWRKLEVVA